ncbi:hypothetical protein ABT297_22535 [Dactylosporangium sp. NPDC000555]|uniref:hypothetical protein n=1 Tax=Dactylosporangium sp. NPDC000555 TaxID=3154260 RepID=UPI00332E7C4B
MLGYSQRGGVALQALYRLNPVEAVQLEEVVDFPAKLTRKRKDWGPTQKIPVVVATFRYDDAELERIEDDLGPGALHTPEFTLTIGYRNTGRTYGHRYNEAAIVKHLRSGLDLPSAAAATVNATSTVAGTSQGRSCCGSLWASRWRCSSSSAASAACSVSSIRSTGIRRLVRSAVHAEAG